MSFTNLRQLAALFKPPVQESVKSDAQFDALAKRAKRAQSDMSDVLSDENMAIFLKKSGLTGASGSNKMNSEVLRSFATFSKSLDKFMLELETMSATLQEATIRDMNSGYTKSSKAVSAVRNFIDGNDTIKMQNGDEYESKGSVISTQLTAGQIVLATYKAYNQGADLVEIQGVKVTDAGNEKMYRSVKEALAAINVKSLKAVSSDIDMRLEVMDLSDGDSGDWYYLFEGRFCRGSGAEPLSFTKAQLVSV